MGLNGSVGVRNGYQPDLAQNRLNYLLGAGLAIPIYTGQEQEPVEDRRELPAQLPLCRDRYRNHNQARYGPGSRRHSGQFGPTEKH